MSTPAVHWREGMFLRPQHFQASQRHVLDEIRRSHKWDVHYNWGVRAIDIDLDALANQRLVVRRLEARLRDGAAINLPEEGELKEVPIKEALRQRTPLMVYLGVPSLYLGRANLALGDEAQTRYRVETREVVDENTGQNPQSISLRRLNCRILLGDHAQAGYETLPLARITKSERAEATPQLDESYVPPLLSSDAWVPFHSGILQALFERIGKKIDTLVKQVAAQNITFDRQAQGDNLILHQLRKLNEAYAVLHVLLFAQGIHPLSAFLELSRLVGQLAIFGAARRAPDLPRYDHDDLYRCFLDLKNQLDHFLNIFVEPIYRERPFVGAGLRMQVALEPRWLESSWQLYIGVRTSLAEEACINLLTRAGQLDMKVGSSDRVENIFRQGHQGLRFELQKRPPSALGTDTGWVFFQIRREAQDTEWQAVQKSLNLAVRINETFIASSIQNQRVLTIKTPTVTTTMEFMLFAVPEDKA